MSKGNTHDNYDFEDELEINLSKNIDKIINDISMNEDGSSGKGNEPAPSCSLDDSSLKNGSFDENEDTSVVFEQAGSGEITDKEDVDKEEMDKKDLDKEVLDREDSGNILKQGNPDENVNREDTDENPAHENPNDNLDETLNNISGSLARQISEELEKLEAEQEKKKKRARMMKIQIGIVAVLLFMLGTACFLGFTQPGNRLLLKMGINIGGKIWDVMTQDFTDNTDVEKDVDYIEEDDLNSDAEEIDPDTIVWPEHPGDGRQEEGVYNILLLGEEAIGSGNSRGRTDLIIIATINKNQKSIKLTSLMRDLLVQIPGYKDNKLNSAYEKGGIDLLYETIAKNFDIRLNGSVLVNFENFEKIIDYLGGLEITLTASEAKYLRNTNYISNPKYRNVVEGKQLMNGNQVLGYARIRKRAAITGNNNDYGRTDRHRIILNAIFEKYKTTSKVELVSMMFKILPLVTTDIDSKTFEKLIDTYFEMGMTNLEIEQLRIPADGTFTDNVKVRGMDVLIPDLEANKKILHEFIFGSY